MSDKAECQHYEVDYEKIVQEISETLYFKEEELERKLQEEKSPIRYIELNAVLTDVKQLRNYIFHMFEYCKKTIQVKVDDNA